MVGNISSLSVLKLHGLDLTISTSDENHSAVVTPINLENWTTDIDSLNHVKDESPSIWNDLVDFEVSRPITSSENLLVLILTEFDALDSVVWQHAWVADIDILLVVFP